MGSRMNSLLVTCPAGRLALLLAAVLLSSGQLNRLVADGPPERAASSPATRNTREALIFRNGDLLYGTLEAISPGQDVRWRHTDVAQPIQFAPDHIAEIHFPPHHRSGTNSPDLCRVRLANGDELEGRLTQLT